LLEEEREMNLIKIFQYGLIITYLCGNAGSLGMDNEHSDKLEEKRKAFKCPTEGEIHTHAMKLRNSPFWNRYNTSTCFTLTTEAKIIFEAQPLFVNRNTVQRVLNLKEYVDTFLVKKNGSLEALLFRYSPGLAQDLILEVDLRRTWGDNKTLNVSVSYSTNMPSGSISSSLIDDKEYIAFKDKEALFTIWPVNKLDL
jgi:hypothetical protein